MLNKTKIFFILTTIFLGTNSLFADGYIGDINDFETHVGGKFDKYVKNAIRKRQMIGIGYSEKTVGIKYTINTSLKPLDNDASNFYTSFIVNDWRFEVEESYDVLQNNGFYNDTIQIRPALGFGVDLKSSNVTGYVGINFLYLFPKIFDNNFFNNLSIGINYKYFFMKEYHSKEVQVPDGAGEYKTITVNEDADKYPFTKNYFNLYINYSF